MRAYGSQHVYVVFVELTDVDGRSGTGFTYTLGLGAEAVSAMVNDVLAPVVRGTRLDQWDATYEQLWNRTRRLGRSVFAPAISALDIAAWDLRGIRTAQALHTLLGRNATPVSMYGSGRSSNELSLTALVEGTTSYVAMGFEAVKLRIGARPVEEDLGRVRAIRSEVGDRVRLMVDCNEQLTLSSAQWLAPRLHELGVEWIEEPFLAEDVRAHSMLAARSAVPIATGEHLVGPYEFGYYIDAHAAGVFQPDAALTGGVTAALRICALAAAHGIPVSFHSLPELHVQLAMGDPNVVYVEHFPVIDPLLAESLPSNTGVVTAPTRPGHGIGWDWDAIATFAVREGPGTCGS